MAQKMGWKEVEGYSLHLEPRTNVAACVCVRLSKFGVRDGAHCNKAARQQRWQQQQPQSQ